MKRDMLILALSAIIKMACGFALLSALLFLPAGTLHYPAAWRLLAVLFIPMVVLGGVILVKSPDLLRSRLYAAEKRSVQQGVVRFSALIFIIGFIVAALDYRHGWSHPPQCVSYIATLIFVVGYGLYFEVMRENRWLSRNIGVAEGQRVITTGLYAIVRHPMYTATILMFLSMPLVLESCWAMVVFLFYIPVIVIRIYDEEQLLLQELEGYREYCLSTRWRLIPYVW